jgi:hypothetical protein
MDLQQVGLEEVKGIGLAKNSVQWRAFAELELEIRFP